MPILSNCTSRWSKGYDLKLQILKLVDQKEGILMGCRALKTFLPKNSNYYKSLFQLKSLFQCLLKKVVWSEDCVKQDNEKLIYRWETKVCFAYQLMTIGRVVFACCLWFCRCMPSNGSRVMDPFPKGTTLEHFDSNIFPILQTVSSWKHISLIFHSTPSYSTNRLTYVLQNFAQETVLSLFPHVRNLEVKNSMSRYSYN